jgi:hypothetical protein
MVVVGGVDRVDIDGFVRGVYVVEVVGVGGKRVGRVVVE